MLFRSVLCGGGPPDLVGGDYQVLWFQTAAPPPPGNEFQAQHAIVFNNDIGEPWEHVSSFPWDTFNGAAIWMYHDRQIGSDVSSFSAMVSEGPGSASPLQTDSFFIDAVVNQEALAAGASAAETLGYKSQLLMAHKGGS